MLSRGSECLSDHPRWMFKKNSMEFFIGLQSYLYYCYSGCTLKSHDHLLFPECSMVTWLFQNVLWSPDLVTWPWLTQSLSYLLLRCILGCLKCVGNLFPTRGSHNTQWDFSTRFIEWKNTSTLLNTAQLQGQVLDTIPELGTALPLSIPNWLTSPLYS